MSNNPSLSFILEESSIKPKEIEEVRNKSFISEDFIKYNLRSEANNVKYEYLDLTLNPNTKDIPLYCLDLKIPNNIFGSLILGEAEYATNFPDYLKLKPEFLKFLQNCLEKKLYGNFFLVSSNYDNRSDLSNLSETLAARFDSKILEPIEFRVPNLFGNSSKANSQEIFDYSKVIADFKLFSVSNVKYLVNSLFISEFTTLSPFLKPSMCMTIDASHFHEARGYIYSNELLPSSFLTLYIASTFLNRKLKSLINVYAARCKASGIKVIENDEAIKNLYLPTQNMKFSNIMEQVTKSTEFLDYVVRLTANPIRTIKKPYFFQEKPKVVEEKSSVMDLFDILA